MDILTANDGSFAFVFNKDEKPLGLAILNSIQPLTPESKKNLDDGKVRVLHAGEPVPTLN